jgi:FixJ family two-component response regulator
VRAVTVALIAVVEDDEALCSSLVDLMCSIGYHAAPFNSAEALLGSSDLLGMGCIIADIHMPGMSGLQLIRVLRERGIGTPVILITALPHKHLDDEARSVGAFCLLRKPFETSSLIDSVERSLLT